MGFLLSSDVYHRLRLNFSLGIRLTIKVNTKTSLPYMYVIEILLKNTAMPMSVQRKTVEEATTVYQQVLEAMKSGDRNLLELTCDR